jgi:hypothetical protein
VISVSFNFSDIAQAAALFAKLTGNELASATVVGPAPAPAVAAPAPKPKKAPSPAPAAESVAAPAPVTAPPVAAPPPAAAPVAPEPAEPAVPAASAVDYPTLQKAVLALYAKDRGAAQAIATGMGFASYKVMPPERWADALEQVNAALGT